MRDYIITSQQEELYIYLHKTYQLELEHRIDSLINYQNWTYPFFRIINNTQQYEVEPFLEISTLSDEDKQTLLNQFPTNNTTLTTYEYVVPAQAVDDQQSVIKDFKILFINELNKHQGVTIYDDHFYISFLSKAELYSYPGVRVDEHGTVILPEYLWNYIHYKPSIVGDSLYYFGAWCEDDPTQTYSSTPETFASYGNRFGASLTSDDTSYVDFHDNNGTIKQKTGQHDEIFRRSSIASMLQAFLFLADELGNQYLPATQFLALMHIPIGFIVFSNTFTQDIDSKMDKVLLFHLSDFSAPIWSYYNNKLHIDINDRASKNYGTNIIMPMPSKDLKFTTDTILIPSIKTQGLQLYSYCSIVGNPSSEHLYDYSGEHIITQPILKIDNFFEEIIGDFKYTQSISKIDNTTNYHYTINNESGYEHDIHVISI